MKKSLLLSLSLLAFPLMASTALTPDQEARVRELVRETLVSNPAILAEAADAWDKQAAQNQQSMLQEAIKKITLRYMKMLIHRDWGLNSRS